MLMIMNDSRNGKMHAPRSQIAAAIDFFEPALYFFHL